jgi:hypothetical protein
MIARTGSGTIQIHSLAARCSRNAPIPRDLYIGPDITRRDGIGYQEKHIK